jgi:hypothetical protein
MRTLTIWSNGGRHEGIIRQGDDIVYRTGLVHNSGAGARRAAIRWASDNPEPGEHIEAVRSEG